MTPLLLGALAVLLAGPVPALLARWPRLRRSPGASLVLWQSVAAAAVLAALGAGLSLTTAHVWAPERDWVGRVIAVVALAVTALVAARLLLSGHRVGTTLRQLRRRHRAQLDLLAHRERGVEVLDHDLPVAYCLPALGGSRVVVSAGMLDRLTEDEVAAVLAHERAHLRSRHDLLLEAFSVLHRAFPRWVSSRAALDEVKLLVEVMADRAAVRGRDPRHLGRALVALAESRVPAAALPAGGAGLVTRVDLLADPDPHRLQSVLVLVAAVLVVVLPTALVVLPWLLSLWAV
ncbi:M56 family metallopeptidase [Nocardioides limicola]|uniref:M56 family metallopeptidase n=1 Tax=Nocardioides limicola TaxID=2803368 RepID=UPI00193BD710|nr:M56 family metallopeptidase [Nocardioides sp. DJM-14]